MKKLLLYYIFLKTRRAIPATAATLVRHLINGEKASWCAKCHPSARPLWHFRMSDCRVDSIIAVASRRGYFSGNRLKSKMSAGV